MSKKPMSAIVDQRIFTNDDEGRAEAVAAFNEALEGGHQFAAIFEDSNWHVAMMIRPQASNESTEQTSA